jgi:hypothetical protein
MILAGEIGGTKTDLAIFTNEGGKLSTFARLPPCRPKRATASTDLDEK